MLSHAGRRSTTLSDDVGLADDHVGHGFGAPHNGHVDGNDVGDAVYDVNVEHLRGYPDDEKSH